MNMKTISWMLAAVLMAAPAAQADEAKGRIKYISNKANTIQLNVKGKDPVVVRFDDNTVFEGVDGIKGLSPPDLIVAEFEPGAPATRIKKVVFGLPPGVEIDIQEMLAILQGQRGEYLLGDARPAKRYVEGHVPSAVSTPVTKPEALTEQLPANKDQLLVFYCGGPTCPFTGQAVEIAQAAGYTNVKGFQVGIPGWKKQKLPVHSSRGWLAKNLDEHHVIIDVRDPALAAKRHIPGAVTLTTAQLAAMTEQFIAQDKEALLPGVKDMRAPVVLYADTHSDRDVLLAFRELRGWGYSGVSVLEGGLDAWMADELPIANDALATEIKYSKALAKGAIAPAEFADLEKSRDNVVFVDVRSDAEVAEKGQLKDSMHMPLDSLEGRLGELPQDKEVIVYCENGIRAEMAYETLRDKGYKTRFLNEVIEFDADGNYSL